MHFDSIKNRSKPTLPRVVDEEKFLRSLDSYFIERVSPSFAFDEEKFFIETTIV